MNATDRDFEDMKRKVRRRRRRRKAPVATVPIVSSEAAPASPGKIEQPDFVKGVGQVYRGPEEDDPNSPIAPGNPKSRVVMTTLRVRHMELLSWYAAQRRITVEAAATEVMAAALAKLKVDHRKSTRGTTGGSVRKGEMGAVIGAPE